MNDSLKGNKKIWFFHHYSTPPNLSGLKRPYFFSKYLIDRGYEATVFASSCLHFSNKQLINDNSLYIKDKSSGVPYIYIKTYNSVGNNINRVLNMVDFAKNLYRVAIKESKISGKPDAIISSSPHPLTLIVGNMLSKKFNIASICEVRDFWPEAFFVDGVIKEDTILGRLLLREEKKIYEHADALIFLKEGDYKYIIDREWDLNHGGNIDLNKIYYINNGVDLNTYNKNLNLKYEDEDLSDNKKFKCVYTGALRMTNNIDNILDSAKLLQNYRDIEFLIFGDGNYKERLLKRVKEEKITNVKIKGYVESIYIPSILAQSSVNILNYSDKYKWDRGNSSNKLFEYMASGRPIISTVRMGYSFIKKYNLGIELEYNTSCNLANAILEIKNKSKEEYDVLCNNSLMASKDFDYKKQTHKLINLINRTLETYGGEN